MDTVLHSVRAPVFSLDACTGSAHLCLVTAGGGAAKSGIKNVVTLISWKQKGEGGAPQPEVVHTFDTGAEIVFGTSASEDGKLLAAMIESGVELFTWSPKPAEAAAAMQRLAVINLPTSLPSCVAWGKGRLLAIGGEDGSVHFYDAADVTRPVLLHSVEAKGTRTQALVFSPSGKLAAACMRDGSTRVFATEGLAASASQPSSAAPAATTPLRYSVLPGQAAAVIGDSVVGASRSRRPVTAGPCQAVGVAFDPREETSLWVLESTARGGAALVRWALGTKEEAGSKAQATPGGDGPGVGPAGRMWYAALVRKASRQPLTCLRLYTQEPGPAVRLLVGTAEGGVQCWSGMYLALQWERPGLHEMSTSCMTVLGDGRTAVSGSPDSSLVCFPLAAPPQSTSKLLLILMLIGLLLALVAAWMLLAEHAQRALEPKGAEL